MGNRRRKTKTTLSSYYKRYIDDKNGIISIEFIKVSGHSNNKYNDRADKLAKSAIFENKVIRDLGGNSGYIISPVVEENIVSLLNILKADCQGLDYSSHMVLKHVGQLLLIWKKYKLRFIII